ncbi:hypothetical protein [uncultured Clostridium sp.]|nr:hypothetical protein [uncultured Clostridium sp.]
MIGVLANFLPIIIVILMGLGIFSLIKFFKNIISENMIKDLTINLK